MEVLGASHMKEVILGQTTYGWFEFLPISHRGDLNIDGIEKTMT
jgi:hypothetical protein